MKLPLVLLALCTACASSPQPTAAEHARVVEYGDELAKAEAACVNDSKTRDEADACRAAAKARINAKYGRDAGP